MNPASPNIKKMSPLFLVADLEQSLNFYIEKLGFEVDFRYEDFYAGIIRNGYSIHLKSGNPAIKEMKNKRVNDNLDLIFSVQEIHDLFEVIKSLSVIIVQPLRNMPYGHEFYISDPDGHMLAFLE